MQFIISTHADGHYEIAKKLIENGVKELYR